MKGRLKQELHKQLLKTEGFELAEDKLTSSAVAAQFFGHAGLPAATDSLAYEPVQRILAIATSDGRVKFVGQDGVERTASSASPSATRYLQFLPKKGALLRVTEDGDLQLWSLTDGHLLESMPFADPVTSVAIMHDEPFILLGCASGNVQVVSMLDSSGCTAVGAAPVHTLELQPFQVDAEEMKGQGAVTCLTTRSHAGRHRMLVLHQDSGATIWDIRYECPVVLARNETAEEVAGLVGAQATSACWIGSQGICFALGYSTGDICVWGLPGPVQQGAPMNQPLEAVLLGKLRVTPEGEMAEAVGQLTYVPGSATECPNNLLVLGGQVKEMFPALTIVPMDCLSGGDPHQEQAVSPFQPHSIPWFGAVQGWALVPPEASINEFDDPTAIMVLTEGGQLMVHDLKTFQPVPLSLPFQELQAVTHCCMCASATEADPGGSTLQGAAKLHSVTLDRLRAVKGQRPGVTSPAGTASKWRWVFSGGSKGPGRQAPPGGSDLYFTGHEDGRVRVWDATGNVPGLLATVPFDSGGPGVRLRPVSCFQVDLLAGMLVVGHSQGEARVYQFSQEEQEVSCVDLDGKRLAEHHARKQPAGFQCILQCTHHAASISGIALACRLKLAALADEAGVVSLVELTRPSIAFEQQVGQQAICSLQFSQQVVPSPTDTKPSTRRSPPGKAVMPDEPLHTRPALFMCQADGSLASLEVAGSSLAGKPQWVHPKNRSQAIGMVLLAADGAPLYPQQTHLQLSWPHNNMVTPVPLDASPTGLSPSADSSAGNNPFSTGDADQAGRQREASDADLHINTTTHEAAEDTLSNRSAAGAYSIDSQSESEDDDYLAAAVAAVDAQQGQGKVKKVKHPHLRALRSKLGSISRGKDREGSGGGSTHAASPTSQQGSSSRGERGHPHTPSSPPDLHRHPFSRTGPASPASTGAGQDLRFSPTAAHAGPLDPAPPPEAQPQPQAQSFLAAPERRVSEPDEQEEVEEQAAAAHVLICCDTSLRLYPAEGIRVGDRSSVKKVNLQEPLGFTAAFHGPQGPGLLAIARTADAGIWTLPGLEPVKVFSLSSCLGFPWSWQAEPSLLTNLHHTCCLAHDGHMALVGPCNEVVTLGVLRGLHPPPPVGGLYDRDLSEASLAAAGAIADLQEQREPWSGVSPRDTTASTADAGSAESPTHAARVGARGGHLGAFFSQMKDAASKVVEEGGAGVAKTLALGKRLGGAPAVHVSRPSPPPLHQLFARTSIEAESSEEIARITDDEEDDAVQADSQNRAGGSSVSKGSRAQESTHRSPQNAFSSLSGAVGSIFQGQGVGGGAFASTSSSQEGSSARAELLHGASQPEARGKGGMRSAAEIRSAYGRSGARERDTRSMMAENVAALEDRGEKLRNLQDKTSDLNDGAADFASVAKALKEQAANRKWWQI